MCIHTHNKEKGKKKRNTKLQSKIQSKRETEYKLEKQLGCYSDSRQQFKMSFLWYVSWFPSVWCVFVWLFWEMSMSNSSQLRVKCQIQLG